MMRLIGANEAVAYRVLERRLQTLVAILASVVLTSTLLMTAGTDKAQAQETFTCDRVASLQGNDNNPGTPEAPVQTVTRLTSLLTPGKTGCLTAGQTFDELVNINEGGDPGNPITLRSTAGGRATFTGQMMVAGSHVVISDLNFGGLGDIANNYPKTYHLGIDGDDVKVVGNDITTPHGICVDVGGLDAYGGPNDPAAVRADGFVLDHNRIHGCGLSNQLDPQTDSGVHGVYLVNTLNAKITNNYIYDNKVRGLQMWPNAVGTLVRHNVLDGNSGNLNIGSYAPNGYFSRDTTITDNIISNSTFAFSKDTAQVFGNFPNDGQTYGNVVTGNCVYQQDPSKNFGGYGYSHSDNILADPLYENRDAKDFDLQSGSPCTGKGPQPNTAPTITKVRPAKGSTTHDRTPAIRATVSDSETELQEANIRLLIDGREIGENDRGYNQATDVLFHTPDDYRLSYGFHTVKVVTNDGELGRIKRWSFKVVR